LGLTRRPRGWLLALLLAAAAGHAQDMAAPDPAGQAMVGWGLQEAFSRLGAPAEVFALRGAQADQDDVVFYYSQHLYLFWFQNRVWQVRYDRRHTGEPFALRMGCSRQRVTEVLGQPLLVMEGAADAPDAAAGLPSLVYQLEDRGYPVRLRLYFEGDRLVDLYCYRADL